MQKKFKTQPLSRLGLKLAEKQHKQEQKSPQLLVAEFQFERHLYHGCNP